ncbi:hypothetical protein BAUCODRAFT_39552 [Baudoinia panamericana UAMH 10762]|uniref:Molybdenum cofactor sulfurase n=1 Tax=Baudoinia panamericana (strain UAMH 10762) TaxID=717646 RepID=M2M465_BAUPA|nr:uncharacterized protein BAUCODRAFT_39552 [Baudoinia panamericana UAMH 10762]EMC91381.1 hypothetical protein BAUCODRAFT_39552 [Baudoinia panamericana UAMH 10762]
MAGLESGNLTPEEYDAYVEKMRQDEYPMIADALYLDHAGTTVYSKRLMERFHRDMMANLLGNPHSASQSSQHATQLIDSVRSKLLHLCNADPAYFDVVFTANATAAIKLVMEAFREQSEGFWYGYHVDSHTSLVGAREVAIAHHCFKSDAEVEAWVDAAHPSRPAGRSQLFAFPAQSNMNGRRLPLYWSMRMRRAFQRTYTLLDAASYASTSPLDLRDVDASPDFTALSLYKIFGFPDLGALIVRKAAAHVFDKRKYFGGGTVDMVLCSKEQWHVKKSGSLHERLEDGTLPVHSILALNAAIDTHAELFGTLDRVSQHTAALAKRLYDGLTALKHGSGRDVCTIYTNASSLYGDSRNQGPIVAFNLRDSNGDWVSNTEIEKLASIKNIHLRTGGVCNPGGIAQWLHLAPWEMRENFSAGQRCGGEYDILNGKPAGVVRLSLGAMSTTSDVKRFVAFLEEFFVNKNCQSQAPVAGCEVSEKSEQRFHIESLTVYPIKSCAGWQISHGTTWEVRDEGLVWDREWCIVHQTTVKALSQKQHPRMALIRPSLDFRQGVLRIHAPGSADTVIVPLSQDPGVFDKPDFAQRDATVCGDRIAAQVYASQSVARFLTEAVGVPCTLARFPVGTASDSAGRHSKAHLKQGGEAIGVPRPLLLSNESPILTISRSSLNRLNEQIKARGGKAAHPSVFRANIVLAESPLLPPGLEQPFAEDHWQSMRIGGERGPVLDFLGGCRRCQMVCIDQVSGEKNQEPFVTLAKTRRAEGKVLFGVHTALRVERAGGAMIAARQSVQTS